MPTEVYIALALIGIALIIYMSLDGYDIGFGLMLPFQPRLNDQRVLVSIVNIGWDGNESWIILIGTLLWGAFPGVYTTLLPEAYLMFIIMIIGYFLRGVSLEFQGTKRQFEKKWRYLFIISSWLIVLPQGIIIGTEFSHFINSDVINHHIYIALITLLLVLLYCINGMNWQYLKSVRRVKKNAEKYSRILIILFLVFFSAWLYILNRPGALLIELSTSRKAILYIIIALMYGMLLFMFSYYLFKIVRKKTTTFYAAMIVDALLVIGVGLFIYPYVTPETTIKNAATPSEDSIIFLVTGVPLCMPFVLWYNLYALKIFRGKQKYVIKD